MNIEQRTYLTGVSPTLGKVFFDLDDDGVADLSGAIYNEKSFIVEACIDDDVGSVRVENVDALTLTDIGPEVLEKVRR